MTTSQNGWAVDTAGSRQDRAALVRDITVPNGVLAGDVAVVFRWLAEQYDTRVERLIKSACWGWYVKQIEGGSSVSNHASGTAVDFNADRHPMGAAPSGSFSAAQIAACRAIVRDAGGVLRWGGDYSGRKDAMHWEIDTSAAKVKAFADKIREESMELTDTQIDEIADRCAEKVWGYLLERPDSTTTPKAKTSAGGYQRYGDVVAAKTTTDVVAALEPKLDELVAAVDALTPPVPGA